MSFFYRNTLGARIRRRMSAIQHSFYLDVNPDHRASVLVAGSGRSGTTWLAEVLNYDNHYRLVGEPFTREHVPIVRHFARLQYVRPDDDADAIYRPSRAILEGRVRTPWTDVGNRRLIARTRLVKDDRCTLMLAWIERRFPGMPIVYIRRHPCAVAYSRCHSHWRVRPRDVYFGQPELMADHLEPFRDLIAAPRTEFESHVVDWCVENLVPHKQLAGGRVLTVDYETLVADRSTGFARVFDYLGRSFDSQALARSKRLSATTFLGRDRARRRARRDIRNWRDEVSAADVRGAMEIVRRFGLEGMYSQEV